MIHDTLDFCVGMTCIMIHCFVTEFLGNQDLIYKWKPKMDNSSDQGYRSFCKVFSTYSTLKQGLDLHRGEKAITTSCAYIRTDLV